MFNTIIEHIKRGLIENVIDASDKDKNNILEILETRILHSITIAGWDIDEILKEELSTDSYLSASSKLTDLGYYKRSDAIVDHALKMYLKDFNGI